MTTLHSLRFISVLVVLGCGSAGSTGSTVEPSADADALFDTQSAAEVASAGDLAEPDAATAPDSESEPDAATAPDSEVEPDTATAADLGTEPDEDIAVADDIAVTDDIAVADDTALPDDTGAEQDTPPVVTSCVSDGVTISPGLADPANICRVCSPTASGSDWEALHGDLPLLGPVDPPTDQGWQVSSDEPASVTTSGSYVEIATSTPEGGFVGGRALLSRPSTLPAAGPFSFSVRVAVVSVNNHNPLDSAAAILTSLTPPYGNQPERAQMLYLDSAAIGWADDTASAAVPVGDGAYRTYTFAVDADGVAHVSVDGVELLTRPGFATNGTLAIGDQTNDPGVDATIRIESVTWHCP